MDRENFIALFGEKQIAIRCESADERNLVFARMMDCMNLRGSNNYDVTVYPYVIVYGNGEMTGWSGTAISNDYQIRIAFDEWVDIMNGEDQDEQAAADCGLEGLL